MNSDELRDKMLAGEVLYLQIRYNSAGALSGRRRPAASPELGGGISFVEDSRSDDESAGHLCN